MKTKQAIFMDDNKFDRLVREHFGQDYVLAAAVEASNPTNLVATPGQFDWQWDGGAKKDIVKFVMGNNPSIWWTTLLEAMVRGGKLPSNIPYVINISW